MRRPRGKLVAIGVCAIALGTLAAAVLHFKDRLVEEYCLRRLDDPDRATSDSAWELLGRVATRHAVPRLTLLLTDERRSDLPRARALHVLRASSREGRIGPPGELPELRGYRLVEAVIESLEGNDRQARINAGTRDGVRRGDFFLVERDGMFVGALRVIGLDESTATGLLLDEPGQRSMRPGDTVVAPAQLEPPLAPALVISADGAGLQEPRR